MRSPTPDDARWRVDAILSPLRYPGGKRRLVQYISEALRINALRPGLFVEPFAGGASVALQLLRDGLVEQIGLGEKDPLVASFWKTAFFDHEWLVRQIEKITPSLALWEHFRAYQPRTDRTRALKCLFLNRTSFSGILSDSSGPIGGRNQQSEYAIGCRFARDTIIQRIEQVARLADRVLFVEHGDWSETMAKVENLGLPGQNVFFYLDPPFYYKADRLYRFYFENAEHCRLRERVSGLRSPYMLSYDAAEPITRLYREHGHDFRHVEMLYSANGSKERARARELIVTNLSELPQVTPLKGATYDALITRAA